jgi:hypothetical protein
MNAQYASRMTIAMAQDPAFPGISKKVATGLRSFNGQYILSTLVLNIGDTLRINLINKLPAA